MNDRSTSPGLRRAKILHSVGVALMLIALVCNQWTLALLSEDHLINDIAYLAVIWVFQLACIGFGILLMLARKRAIAGKILLLAVSCLIVSPLMLECGLRVAILLNLGVFRDPGLYADALADDDYWKLLYQWAPRDRLESKSEYALDPELGWVTPRSDQNPLGVFAMEPATPQFADPALLFYGDSFTHGFQVLEDHLDPELRERLQIPVYNFGVPGYGLDQSLLRFQATRDPFSQPQILFGLLTSDIDRCLLSIRGAPKPYFSVENEDLVLQGVPLASSTADWIAEHPPQISSFLVAFVSQQVKRFTQDWSEGPYRRDEKIRLAKHLLEKLHRDADQAELPLTVVVFYTPREFPITGWRERVVLDQCRVLGMDVIDTKPILLEAARRADQSIESYYRPDDHLNELGNRVVARSLGEYFAGRTD